MSRPESRAAIAKRIIIQIEDLLFGDYPGEGIMSLFVPRLGAMFFELPLAMQRNTLYGRIDWTGLTDAEQNDVIERVLADVRVKVPEEIYPATWFDGVLVEAAPDAKVHDLRRTRRRRRSAERRQNLDERVCARGRAA